MLMCGDEAGDIVPCYVYTKSCVGLLSATLVDTARSLHHFFNWFVVAKFELMDHLLTVLNNSNLTENNDNDQSLLV